MIICFECDAQTQKSLETLVRTGKYSDFGEAICAALRNLEVLERAMGDCGSLVLEQGVVEALHRATRSRELGEPSADAHAQSMPTAWNVPLLFHRFPEDWRPELFSPTIEEDSQANGFFTLDQWPFGQLNKILPAKVSCRGLGNLIRHAGGRPLVLEPSAMEIATAAMELGDVLRSMEKAVALDRDLSLSVGFPRSDRSAVKGRLRFASQFVGSTNKKLQLSGMLFALRLAGSLQDDPLCIALTEAGFEFARIPNPVLDEPSVGALRRLAVDEIAFLLRHIRDNVPAEHFAQFAVLSAIAKGADTPSTLDSRLHDYQSTSAIAQISDAYLSSQRAGVISRMADLGLVTRVRNGVHVSYSVTRSGEGVLADSHLD